MNFKRILKYLLLIILVGILFFVFQNVPASSEAKDLPRLADTSHVRKSLELITATVAARSFQNTNVLDTVAERIRQEFLKSTDRVSFQTYKVQEKEYKN